MEGTETGPRARRVDHIVLRPLSVTEVRLASALAAGLTDSEIAVELALAPHKVEDAIAALCDKLAVASRTELGVFLGALGDAARTAEHAQATGRSRNGEPSDSPSPIDENTGEGL